MVSWEGWIRPSKTYQAFHLIYIRESPVSITKICLCIELSNIVECPLPSHHTISRSPICIKPGVFCGHEICILWPHQSCQIVCNRPIHIICKSWVRPGDAGLYLSILTCSIAGNPIPIYVIAVDLAGLGKFDQSRDQCLECGGHRFYRIYRHHASPCPATRPAPACKGGCPVRGGR